MKERTGSKVPPAALTLVVASALAAAAACGDDPVDPNGNGDDGPQPATVTGTVDALVPGLQQPGLGESAARSGAGGGAMSAQDVDSLKIGRGRADGSVEVIGGGTTTEISGDTYVFPEAQPGNRNLTVVAFSGAERVGKALVYGRTVTGGELVVEPMDEETSMEGAVFNAALRGQHINPEELFHTPQLGLVYRPGAENAEAVATSTGEIGAVATAYDRSQKAFFNTFGAFEGTDLGVEYDVSTVNAALREVGQNFATARHGGTDAASAHQQFVEDAVATYAAETGSDEASAIAWTGFATFHDRHLAGAASPIRLDQARNLLVVSLESRLLLLDELDGDGATAVEDALADVRSGIDAATSVAELEAGRDDARQTGIDDLRAAIADGGEQEFDDAVAAADLAAFIAATLEASDADESQQPFEVAAEMPTYVDELDAAVENFVAATGSGVEATTVRRLLLALMGGPGFGT